MKKTLITLLALAGVACGIGKDDLNSQLATDLRSLGYQEGDAFTITLTDIDVLGSNGFDKFLTLTSTVSIYNQVDYFVSINAGSTSNSWLDASKYTVDTENKTAAITLAANDIDGKGYWFAGRFETNSDTKELEFFADGAENPAEVTALTVNYSSDKTTSIIVTRTDDSVFTLNITNLELNAKDIQFAHGSTSIGSMKVVPEPATATLSLLALAGLAVRRRRK